jgi:hypothetical protein
MSELWPQEFRAAAEQVFGRLDNTTYAVVNRRVEHAFKVWRRRYVMTPEQETYAWELLAHAVLSAWRSVQGRSDIEHPYIYLRKAVSSEMEGIVNHPRGHEGFKRRAGLVDVRAILLDQMVAAQELGA